MPSRTGEMFEAVQGAVSETTTGDTTIIAAPGASISNFITKILVTVSVYTATSVIAIEDGAGGDRLGQWMATGHYMIDFGERGYKQTANTVLNLTVETANSTVHVTAIGYKSDKAG